MTTEATANTPETPADAGDAERGDLALRSGAAGAAGRGGAVAALMLGAGAGLGGLDYRGKPGPGAARTPEAPADGADAAMRDLVLRSGAAGSRARGGAIAAMMLGAGAGLGGLDYRRNPEPRAGAAPKRTKPSPRSAMAKLSRKKNRTSPARKKRSKRKSQGR